MNTAMKFVGALCLVAVVSECGEGADGEGIGASESGAVASSTVTSSADVTSVEETSSEAEPTNSGSWGLKAPWRRSRLTQKRLRTQGRRTVWQLRWKV